MEALTSHRQLSREIKDGIHQICTPKALSYLKYLKPILGSYFPKCLDLKGDGTFFVRIADLEEVINTACIKYKLAKNDDSAASSRKKRVLQDLCYTLASFITLLYREETGYYDKVNEETTDSDEAYKEATDSGDKASDSTYEPDNGEEENAEETTPRTKPIPSARAYKTPVNYVSEYEWRRWLYALPKDTKFVDKLCKKFGNNEIRDNWEVFKEWAANCIEGSPVKFRNMKDFQTYLVRICGPGKDDCNRRRLHNHFYDLHEKSRKAV